MSIINGLQKAKRKLKKGLKIAKKVGGIAVAASQGNMAPAAKEVARLGKKGAAKVGNMAIKKLQKKAPKVAAFAKQVAKHL